MSTPAAYPDDKKNPELGYVDGVESDSEGASFSALIAEGKQLMILSNMCNLG
jgi:hypothetical protein